MVIERKCKTCTWYTRAVGWRATCDRPDPIASSAYVRASAKCTTCGGQTMVQVHVGPDFGCVHWQQASSPALPNEPEKPQ